MTYAIRTKYLPVTTHKGSRVKAAPMVDKATEAVLRVRSVTKGYYDAEGDGLLEKHAHVAKALAELLGWKGVWFAGDDGAGGYVFVRASGSGWSNEHAFVVE